MQSTRINIAIAGTTRHTLMCAQALKSDDRFTISWVLTPSARLVGRQQILTKNPLHQWAEDHQLPVINVEKKINHDIESQIKSQKSNLHFLLVVDFGYLIPDWLLELPTSAPLNIHPSALPKYRGSSPGQFALLSGDKTSAITLMIMNEGLDTGDTIAQLPFSIDDHWTATDYYDHAFELICQQLPDLIFDLSCGKIKPTPQPINSPTPIARRLSKDDGFVHYDLLSCLIPQLHQDQCIQLVKNESSDTQTSELIRQAHELTHHWPQAISQAVRAFSPWPGVWTMVPTSKGDKRMKILQVSVKGNELNLEKVQLEGLQPTTFDQIKNQIV